MAFGRGGEEELHRHPLFLVQQRRYLRLVSRQAHDFSNHAFYYTALTYGSQWERSNYSAFSNSPICSFGTGFGLRANRNALPTTPST